MLPNHSPLVIAEQFGTLAALHPGRIDLGLGRAPGTDQLTMLALRRDHPGRRHLPAGRPRAPGAARRPAARAGGAGDPRQGLARAALDPRLEPLRRAARRGARAAVRVRVALRARRAPAGARDLPRPLPALASSCNSRTRWSRQRDRRRRRRGRRSACSPRAQQSFTNIFRGRRGQLPPPIDDIEAYWSPDEKAPRQSMLSRSFVGSPETVRRGLEALRRGDRRGRADRRGCDPRPRGAASLLRAPRRDPERADVSRRSDPPGGRRHLARSRLAATATVDVGECPAWPS